MQVGRKCSANYNTGTYGTPTWTALGRVSSPKGTRGRPTSRRVYREATTSKNVTGVLDNGWSFKYVPTDPGQTDTVLAALVASLEDGTQMDLAFLDTTAGSGAKGVRGPFVVSQMDRNEDDEDAVDYDVTVVEVEDVTNDAEVDSYTIS